MLPTRVLALSPFSCTHLQLPGGAAAPRAARGAAARGGPAGKAPASSCALPSDACVSFPTLPVVFSSSTQQAVLPPELPKTRCALPGQEGRVLLAAPPSRLPRTPLQEQLQPSACRAPGDVTYKTLPPPCCRLAAAVHIWLHTSRTQHTPTYPKINQQQLAIVGRMLPGGASEKALADPLAV